MPQKCFVPGCNTGLPSERKKLKNECKPFPSIFHPPENMIDVWNGKIHRADKALSKKDGICELHFLPSDIIKSRMYENEDGSKIVYPLLRPNLQPEAIPCIFPNLPKYLSSKNSKKRKPPAKRATTVVQNKKRKSSLNDCSNKLVSLPDEDTSFGLDNLLLAERSAETIEVPVNFNIHTSGNFIKLPGPLWGLHTDGIEQTLFTHIDGILNDKCVQFITSKTAKVFIRGKDIGFDTVVDSYDDVEKLLIKIEQIKICPGFSINDLQQWSPKCLLHTEGKNIRCKHCSYKNKIISKKKCLSTKSLKLHNKRAQQARRLSRKVSFIEVNRNVIFEKNYNLAN